MNGAVPCVRQVACFLLCEWGPDMTGTGAGTAPGRCTFPLHLRMRMVYP